MEYPGGAYYDLAEAMRNLTYEPGLVKSFVSTVLYLCMVYYLVKFLIIYFKRLFVTIILILLGPFMGVKFAIDRLKFKSSTSFTNWAKEYIFSVGTQTIHALVYTIFVGMAYATVKTTDTSITWDGLTGQTQTAIMATCILAFIFFKFMTEAEKMLRGFLKLTGDTASNIMGDAESTDIKEIIGIPIFMKMYKYAKATPLPDYVKKKYESGKKYMKNNMESEYVKMRRSELIEKYKDAYEPDERNRMTEITSNIDDKIETILRAEFKNKLDAASERISTAGTIAWNSGQIIAGLPVAVIGNTLIGTGLVFLGGKTLYQLADGKITKYRKKQKEIKLRANSEATRKVERWMDANATKEVAQQFKERYMQDETKEQTKNTIKLELLHKARQAEINLQQAVENKQDALLGVDKNKKDDKKPLSEENEAAKLELQKKLAAQYRRNLKRSVDDALKTVDKTEIKYKVKEYMKANNKHVLTYKDIEMIAEKFDVRVENTKPDENVVENQIDMENFMENVKLEAKSNFVRVILVDEKEDESTIVTEESLDQVEENIEKKIEKTKESEEKRSMLLAIKCIKDKRHELNGEKKENVFGNLTEEERNKIQGIVKEATDDDAVEQHIGKMEVKEIVDTMKKAVDKEGSIKKDYPEMEKADDKAIIDEVRKLKEINEVAKETTGKPIYTDIGKLVNNMISTVVKKQKKKDNQDK